MPSYEIDTNSDESLSDKLDEDEEIVDVTYVGSVEEVETEEVESFDCELCGESFDSREARNGHMANCPEDDGA